MSAVMAAVSLGFIPAVGSSSSSRSGSLREGTRQLQASLVAVGQVLGQLVVPTGQARPGPAAPVPARPPLPPPAAAVASTARWSTKLARSWRCMPTSTFSSAVMFWKSRMFWNVRPMPAADHVVRPRAAQDAELVR